MNIQRTLLVVLAAVGGTLSSAAVASTVASAAESEDDPTRIILQDFSSEGSNNHATWKEMNDPVMGGQSTGSFTIDNGVGHFQGHVAIVPFLQAPGFIKAETQVSASLTSWPDISSCAGIELVVSSSTPTYQGFRFSFGNARPPNAFPYIYGYKTSFMLEDTEDYGQQSIAFSFSAFSDDWDAKTGDAKTLCSPEHPEVCPDEKTLQGNLYSLAIWGEGVEGDVDLQIHKIQAWGCAEESQPKVNDYDSSDKDKDETADPATNNNNDDEDINADHVTTDEIMIEDFANPQHPWGVMNDPVMGGQSTSSLSIDNDMAQFRGTCAIVPFLKAPGFITMVTGGYRQPTQQFPNVESCQALKVVLQSETEYKGYYMSFGNVQLPEKRYARGYKTHLEIPQAESDDDWIDVTIPFSEFSSKWDEGTGHIEVSCQDDAKYCPTPEALQDLQTISFWGEGVEGEVALNIKSISAVQCASSASSNSTTPSNDTNDSSSSSENSQSQSQSTTSSNGGSGMRTLFWLVAIGGALYATRDTWKTYLPQNAQASGGTNGYNAVPEIQLA